MKITSILFAAMLVLSSMAYAQSVSQPAAQQQNSPRQNPPSGQQNTPPQQGQGQNHSGQGQGEEDNFAEHKSEMVSELNEEKAGLDKVINCVNAAKKKEDIKACNEIRKDNMEKMHARKIARRKEFLQNQLNKLDAESKAPKNN